MSHTESPAVELIRQQLLQFMDEHIYPNEETYAAQLAALPSRFSTVQLFSHIALFCQCSEIY